MCVDFTAEKTNVVYRGVSDQSSWGGAHLDASVCGQTLESVKAQRTCRHPELERVILSAATGLVHHVIKRRSAEGEDVSLRPESRTGTRELLDLTCRTQRLPTVP